MEKIIRVGKVEDQDDLRQADTAKMTPNSRLASMIKMQSHFLRWDLNPSIERTAILKRKDFKDVS